MKKNKKVQEKNFIEFLKEKEQKNELLIILIYYIIALIFLRYLYPYPNGFSDSGGYVAAAVRGAYDGYRPYGYSNFLSIIHKFSHSISFLIIVQYIINVIASVFFIFSLKYVFTPVKKFVFYLALVFSLVSPLTLYLTNSILSDSIFSSLTILWIGCNIWFVHSKQNHLQVSLIFIKFFILYLLINLRYTGFFYFGIEFLLITVILIKKRRVLYFISTLVLIIIVSNFYSKQVTETKRITSIETFCGFAGWQSANNALHVVPYIKLDSADLNNKQFKEFAFYAKSLDSTLVVKQRTTAGFMWDKKSPLKQYLFRNIQMRQWSYIKTWTYLGKEVYGRFGRYIMLKYPWEYLCHFLIPNSYGVFLPKGDQLYRSFNEQAIPTNLMEEWFHVPPGTKPYFRSRSIQKISLFFPAVRLIIWIALTLLVAGFLVKKKWKYQSVSQNLILAFMTVFVFAYAAFHIYSTPFELRYIVPVHLAQIAIIYIIINKFMEKKQLQ